MSPSALSFRLFFMNVFAGIAIVLICCFGGYVLQGGSIEVILHALPGELFVIGGAAIGALVISNPGYVLKKFMKAFGHATKGEHHDKQSYLELLTLLYQVFKMVKTKGILAIEAHVEKPDESDFFKKFPHFYADKHAVVFLCDYLRLWTLGTDNPHEMESLMDEELATHHHEHEIVVDAMQKTADGLPALGIVAAVLGVIKTMGSIDQPPVVLGKMIGHALVGTFLGVFLAYGMAGPLATLLKNIYGAEGKYYQCIKAGLLAHMHGYAPAISTEFARKALFSHTRPSFYEVEEAVNQMT
ncbi:MAG: flagellar motor stator protein MotA [Dongiaceae bacterium]